MWSPVRDAGLGSNLEFLDQSLIQRHVQMTIWFLFKSQSILSIVVENKLLVSKRFVDNTEQRGE